MSISKVQVTPDGFDGIGYFTCREDQAISFSVHYFGCEKGYGEGWFPAYDLSMNYRYKTRVEAEAKAKEFCDRKNLDHLVTA